MATTMETVEMFCHSIRTGIERLSIGLAKNEIEPSLDLRAQLASIDDEVWSLVEYEEEEAQLRADG